MSGASAGLSSEQGEQLARACRDCHARKTCCRCLVYMQLSSSFPTTSHVILKYSNAPHCPVTSNFCIALSKPQQSYFGSEVIIGELDLG